MNARMRKHFAVSERARSSMRLFVSSARVRDAVYRRACLQSGERIMTRHEHRRRSYGIDAVQRCREGSAVLFTLLAKAMADLESRDAAAKLGWQEAELMRPS